MPRFLRSESSAISEDLSKLSISTDEREDERAKRRLRREKLKDLLDKENVSQPNEKVKGNEREKKGKGKKQRKPKRKSSFDESEDDIEQKRDDDVPKKRRPTQHVVSDDVKVPVKWPVGMLRYDYRVFTRSNFHSLALLTKGGVGVVFTAKAVFGSSRCIKTPVKKEGGGFATPKVDRKTKDVVLKIVQDPTDWNDELTGFWNSRLNPYVVNVIGVVLLSGEECNELCQDIEGYKTRPEGELIPSMVFEKWDGSIEDALDKGLLPEWGLPVVLDLLIDVAMAVSLLHKSGNMHRDIKCANILYRIRDKKFSAALCDLGLATTLGPTTRRGGQRLMHTQGVGTDGFMAPECRDGTNYSTPADIFSLSVACEKIIIAVKPKQQKLEPLFRDLMTRGQSVAPEKRPTADEFLEELNSIKLQLAEAEVKLKEVRSGSGSRGPRRRLPLSDLR